MTTRIHPTALIEAGVEIGSGSSVWDSVHIRHHTRIGRDCIIGEKTHISYDVHIGNLVKINAFVYICTGVTIEDGVMISAGCIFTNDRFPRATGPELQSLRTSDPDENTLLTVVRSGATLGAGCVVGCGLSVGRFAMVGMGSLITHSIPDFHLAVGRPARSVGYVCRCGQPFARLTPGAPAPDLTHICTACQRQYSVTDGAVSESLVAAA
jgi:UDP-2-acetamido-3-amino-2,3-dideoxy-glucuronate N-acetyltransferase